MQDLFDQVVDDVAVVSREARDEAGDIVSPLDRQRRQLEGRDPALGARLQRGDFARAEIQPHHLVEVGGGLLGREAQIRRTDLGELAARPQAGQRQRRIRTGGDHQVNLRGQVLEEERHPVLDVVRVDHVVVVEHQHDVVGSAPSSLSSVVRTVSIGGGWGPCSRDSARAPTPGATVWNAATR